MDGPEDRKEGGIWLSLFRAPNSKSRERTTCSEFVGDFVYYFCLDARIEVISNTLILISFANPLTCLVNLLNHNRRPISADLRERRDLCRHSGVVENERAMLLLTSPWSNLKAMIAFPPRCIHSPTSLSIAAFLELYIRLVKYLISPPTDDLKKAPMSAPQFRERTTIP